VVCSTGTGEVMDSQPKLGVSRKVVFGPFEYEEPSGELRKYGTRIRLQGQPLQILIVLLGKAGHTISREEFQQSLWHGSTFVDFEHGLNAAVNRLRQALGDSADQPRYIETLSGRGYRFIAPIKYVSPGTMPPASAAKLANDPGEVLSTVPNSTLPARPSKRWAVILCVLAFAIPALVACGLWLHHWVRQQAEFYRLEVQGTFFVSKWTEAEVRKGIEYYNRAIALNPGSASAHVGLATGWSFLSDLHSPPHEAMPRAKAAALEAVRLDDSLGEAHVALGVVKMQYDWDWAGAEREFRRAIALNPADGLAHRLYGWLLIALGRFDEAQAEIRRPLDADPLDDFNLMELGLSYYFARQYEQAVEQCRRAIGVDSTLYWSHMVLGWAHEQQGGFSAAIDEFSEARRLRDNSQVTASLGHAYAASDRRADAQKVIAALQESSKRRYVSPYDVATIYAGLGDQEQTLLWLERAYDDRSGWLALWVKVDPKFDALRSEPRFQNLLRRMGHAP
jgi:DNA-binding winged helix-turn-helix (wHTH) protein/Flp pilus assembly protein TadD